MAYNYLTPENIVETYRLSKAYTEGLTDHFFEYERLMRNKPHGSVPKELPKTTDGTTASIIRKTPHRIIQQLPTGRVKGATEDWLNIVAEDVYTQKIIPSANEGYALLQKCWNVVERSLSFGFCPTYVPFVSHGGYFCTDLRLPYWGDVFIQPGKLSDSDSNYAFMRSWWQTKDIEALIDSQSKLSKDVRTWDVDALRKVKDIVVSKEEKAKTPTEREQAVNEKGGVELITGFQVGKGSKFYTFHVQNTGTGEKPNYEGTIVRTKPNKDPRGDMPLLFAYGDIDGASPLGRSIIELVGGIQNLLDGEMQMYQFNRALMLAPPIIKKGNFSKNKIKLVPNHIMDLGTDPNASVEPMIIDTSAIQNFPNNYGLMKSQMLNLLSSPDTSTSAEIGNPGFSKTPAGVQQIQANVSVDDNYMRKQFETWFERWSETAINLFFAERSGVEELQLSEDAADQLRKLAKRGKFDEELISEDNKIKIDYDSATEALKFEVDASTSKMQDEVKQLQSLTGIVDLLDKSSFLQNIVPPNKQMALWNALVNNSGIEQPEELVLDDDEMEAATQQMQQQREMEQQAAQAAAAPPPDTSGQVTPEHILSADQQAHQQEMEKEKLDLEKQNQLHQQEMAMKQHELSAKQAEQQAAEAKAGGKTKPKAKTAAPAPAPQQPEQPQQGGISPEDQQFIEALKAAGFSDQQIGQALAMLHHGVPVEEIIKMLTGGQ